MRPRVFVTRTLPGGALEEIRSECVLEIWPEVIPPDEQTLLERVRDQDGLLTMLTDHIDTHVLEAAGPRLKVVSNYAVGFDNIHIAAATRLGIAVGNTPFVLTETTADLASTPESTLNV